MFSSLGITSMSKFCWSESLSSRSSSHLRHSSLDLDSNSHHPDGLPSYEIEILLFRTTVSVKWATDADF